MRRRLLAGIGHDDTHPSISEPAAVETCKKEVIQNRFSGLKCPQGIAVVPIRQLPLMAQQCHDDVTLRPLVAEIRLDLDVDGGVIAADDIQ
jgi:hypothetical protein